MYAEMDLACGWLEERRLRNLRYTRNSLQGARRRKREKHWAGEAERPVKKRIKTEGEKVVRIKTDLHSAVSKKHAASSAIENPYFVCDGGKGVVGGNAVVWDRHCTHIQCYGGISYLYC